MKGLLTKTVKRHWTVEWCEDGGWRIDEEDKESEAVMDPEEEDAGQSKIDVISGAYWRRLVSVPRMEGILRAIVSVKYLPEELSEEAREVLKFIDSTKFQ